MPRWLVVVCLLAGCRWGFDDNPTRDADASDASDAADDAATHVVPISVSPAPFTTASTTFVDIPGATLTIPPSPGVSWLLLTSAALESTLFADVTVEARYLVDGVERGMGGTQNSVIGRPGPWQHVYVVDGTTAAQQIVYQLRENTGGAATIAQLSAIALPLPASVVHYASADDIALVTTVTIAPVVTLSLGPLSGEYVFLLVANATDLPGLSNINLEWRGPSNEVWMGDTQQPREGWQSYFAIRRQIVDVADATATLNAVVGGGMSQIRNVRVVALPSDAFASVDYARNDVYALITNPVPTTMTAVVPQPSSAQRYLYLGSIRLEETCNLTPDADRGAHFVVDGTETVVLHATDNCAYAATYGSAQLLTSQPTAISTAISSTNGEVRHLDSALLLLGLP